MIIKIKERAEEIDIDIDTFSVFLKRIHVIDTDFHNPLTPFVTDKQLVAVICPHKLSFGVLSYTFVDGSLHLRGRRGCRKCFIINLLLFVLAL